MMLVSRKPGLGSAWGFEPRPKPEVCIRKNLIHTSPHTHSLPKARTLTKARHRPSSSGSSPGPVQAAAQPRPAQEQKKPRPTPPTPTTPPHPTSPAIRSWSQSFHLPFPFAAHCENLFNDILQPSSHMFCYPLTAITANHLIPAETFEQC